MFSEATVTRVIVPSTWAAGERDGVIGDEAELFAFLVCVFDSITY